MKPISSDATGRTPATFSLNALIEENPSGEGTKLNLREKTISGFKWSIFSQLVSQGFAFVTSLVIARILEPEYYGLVGMTTVFSGFAALFAELGLGPAIIQRKDLDIQHLNVAFWLNVVMGAMLTICFLVAAPLLGRFYNEPALTPISRVIGLRFVLSSLNVVQLALLARSMRFRKLSVIDIASNVISGLVGICLALMCAGVWALVWAPLSAVVVTLVLSWRVAEWIPRFSFEWRACKDLFGFSGYMMGFNIINYWARNLDKLLLGRYIGPSSLGIYTRSYSLMLMPLTQVSSVLGKVMFPALSAIQHDKLRVKRVYLKSIGAIALFTFPMMIGLFIVSESFVATTLGAKWAGVVPLLKIFCGIGLLQSVTTTVGWIPTTQGRTDIFFKVGLANAIVSALSFVVGLHWGAVGVAVAYAIGNIILLYPTWSICGRAAHITFLDMLGSLWTILGCSLLMGAGMWLIKDILSSAFPHWATLLLLTTIGTGLYWLLLEICQLQAWKFMKQMLSESLAMMFKGRNTRVETC